MIKLRQYVALLLVSLAAIVPAFAADDYVNTPVSYTHLTLPTKRIV